MDGERRRYLAWAAAILVAGCVLRFAALGQKALWSDELASIQRVQLGFPEHVRALRGVHPLYEILLRGWMPADGSDAWLRIPSAVFGSVALVLVWMLARNMFGDRPALVAAALFALSPLHLMFSRIGRPYALSVLLVALSSLLLWRMRRGGTSIEWAAYVLATTLSLYANFLACAISLAQNVFMFVLCLSSTGFEPVRSEHGQDARATRDGEGASARSHQNGRRLLVRWVMSQVLIGLLFLPWLIYSLPGAAEFGSDTVYRARQFGLFAKFLYLPFTFCLGETVHPLNPALVPAGAAGFGMAFAAGVLSLWRRRDHAALFVAAHVGVTFLIGLFFAAASPKHLTVILPAWGLLIACGLVALPRRLAPVAAALVLASVGGSLVNYFTNREFADADMVTPWRKIAAAVEKDEGPHDALVIGYHGDRGVHDMFRRYYRGRLEPEYLDFEDWSGFLAARLAAHPRAWVLLHDIDARYRIEDWLRARGARLTVTGFQMEEHTLRGLQEGLRHVHEYRSFLYRLCFVGPRP